MRHEGHVKTETPMTPRGPVWPRPRSGTKGLKLTIVEVCLSSRENSTRELQARVDELEEEVRQQRELLAPKTQYSVNLGPTRRRLLAALHAARGAPRTRDWLLSVVWRDEDVCDTNVRMQVDALRKILEPLGVRVLCRRPSLYLIDPETLPVLDSLKV